MIRDDGGIGGLEDVDDGGNDESWIRRVAEESQRIGVQANA